MRLKVSVIKVCVPQVDYLRFGLTEYLEKHYKAEINTARAQMLSGSKEAATTLKNLNGFATLAKEILGRLKKEENGA